MPFPFGKSHKSPADIVKNLKDSMSVLEKQDISDRKAEKATEEVSKNLVAMKEILYGTNEKEPQTEAVAQLAQELYNSGLLSTLIADLQLIDFEVSPPPPTPPCCTLRKMEGVVVKLATPEPSR
uniref:Calcium binding protein 39 n=1 Tax=Paramormyrops kingsleyae TaxID=1676925 RepID=A0A3B3SAG2_9TELE